MKCTLVLPLVEIKDVEYVLNRSNPQALMMIQTLSIHAVLNIYILVSLDKKTILVVLSTMFSTCYRFCMAYF